MLDVHQRQVVTVAGDAPSPVALAAGPRTAVVDGVEVELGGEAVVGGRSDLHFSFRDARTGRPSELDVHAEFDAPGVHQLWGQFRLASGDVLTAPFTVQAS